MDKLNDFIFGEAEPWYLKLQNQVVGSRARLNYSYYVHRRARNSITVGHLVTPATDPGDYVTQENTVVDLRAGREINLKPGVHFQPGSTVHLKIEFEECPRPTTDLGQSGSGERQHIQREIREEGIEQQFTSKEKQARLYPNPSLNGTFVLQAEREEIISGVRIFNLYGTLMEDIRENSASAIRFNKQLPTGTYVVQIMFGDQLEIHKLVVL